MSDLVKRLLEGGETCGIDACKVKDARSGCLCATAADRIEALEAALREINEVYAGSEGIPQPISASEGYLLQLIKDITAISRAALAGEKKDEN